MSFIRPGSGRSRHSSEGFDLNTDQCLTELKRLVVSSGISQASIHLEVDGKIQKKTLRRPQPQESFVTAQPRDRSHPEVSATGEFPPAFEVTNPSRTSSENNADEVGAKTIYAIGSLTKFLINIAYSKLISKGQYKDKGLSWDKSACDLLNEVRRAQGKSRIRRTTRDPSILELLLHRNGFAPMNRALFAPDGTFLVSEDEFLEIAPRMTEDYFKGGQQGWRVYSNANHIFAGILLEEIIGEKLPKIMQDVVFNPLHMMHTVMDMPSLQALQEAGAVTAEGHRVSGDMTRLTRLSEQRYLTNTVEVASLGARSCTEDIAKLVRETLMALDDMSTVFQKLEVLHFFGPKGDSKDGGKMALGGLHCALNSSLCGSKSLNRALVPLDEYSPYSLGRLPNGSQSYSYYTAGSIDGFTSSLYVSLGHRAFAIVLGNSTGPVDVTDHIARYMFQDVMALSPPVDIISRAIEEGLRASQKLQEFEREDADLSKWTANIEGFVGIYKHTKYGQELQISIEGYVVFRGKGKNSSMMEARVSGSTLRIFPGPDGFSTDRWTVWSKRDFTMQEHDGESFLVELGGGDCYQRTSTS